MEKHFLIEVLDWAEKRSNGFNYQELISSQRFEPWEKTALDSYFRNAYRNYERKEHANYTSVPETIFHVIDGSGRYDDSSVKYVLTYDALFKYVDYKELEFARENARQAKKLSLIAIWISGGALIVSTLIPWLIAMLVTQTVQIKYP